jgi:hypothetical protein
VLRPNRNSSQRSSVFLRRTAQATDSLRAEAECPSLCLLWVGGGPYPDPPKARLIVIEKTNEHPLPISRSTGAEIFVDLNYLFHRQQVERSRSETAETKEARTVHGELAKRYEECIETVTGDDYRFPNEE